MRVIAGKVKNLNLQVADNSTTRPFLESARGAVFNMLGSSVFDAQVLDLFAGSGSLGIEALSRGASFCYFVEKCFRAYRVLQENISRCHFEDQSVCIRNSVENSIKKLSTKFNLVFIDPPFLEAEEYLAYEKKSYLMTNIIDILQDDGIVVFRYENISKSIPMWSNLELIKNKRYGRSTVCIYIKQS